MPTLAATSQRHHGPAGEQLLARLRANTATAGAPEMSAVPRIQKRGEAAARALASERTGALVVVLSYRWSTRRCRGLRPAGIVESAPRAWAIAKNKPSLRPEVKRQRGLASAEVAQLKHDQD